MLGASSPEKGLRSNSQVQGSSESLYMSPDPRLWSHSVSGATKAWRVCSSKPMGCLSERPRVPVLRTGQTAPVSTLSSKPSNVHRERDPRKWIRGGEKSDLVPSTGCTPQNSPEGPQAELDHTDYPNELHRAAAISPAEQNHLDFHGSHLWPMARSP